MRLSTALLSSILAFAASATALADDATPPARVSFCGTVVQFVESGCFGVPASPVESKAYDITGFIRRPPSAC